MDNKKFIDNLASAIGKNREDISEMAEYLSGIIAASLKEGDAVAIPAFGTLETKLKTERITVHPSTGKRLLVPPKISVNFKPSSLLKQKIR